MGSRIIAARKKGPRVESESHVRDKCLFDKLPLKLPFSASARKEKEKELQRKKKNKDQNEKVRKINEAKWANDETSIDKRYCF